MRAAEGVAGGMRSNVGHEETGDVHGLGEIFFLCPLSHPDIRF